MIIAETEKDGFNGWQLWNVCGIAESAIVSSLYQADKKDPDAARSAGLASLVEAIANQWWSYTGGANVSEWKYAFSNYSTYLYMKHLYGKDYADEALKEPWYKTAKYQQNAFYCCNMQYTSILPKKDAVAVYLPYQNVITGTEYINTSALFHAEELLGGEGALVQKLIKLFNKWKRENFMDYQSLPYLDYETLLVDLGLTPEEFEAW